MNIHFYSFFSLAIVLAGFCWVMKEKMDKSKGIFYTFLGNFSSFCLAFVSKFEKLYVSTVLRLYYKFMTDLHEYSTSAF